MSRLLRADFARLWRSVIFWLCVMFGAGLAMFIVIVNRHDAREFPDLVPHMEMFLIVISNYMCIVAAVFVSMFVGTEYRDGAIRNKLTVGCGRFSVYLSDLVVCVSAMLMTYAVYVVTLSGMSKLLLGGFDAPVKPLIKPLLISVAAVVAFTAIVLLISMLIDRKATAAVAALIVAIVMIMAAAAVDYRVNAPEYIESTDMVYYIDENGEEQMAEQGGEPVKNSQYITGFKRAVYEELYDWMPTGQIMQLMNGSPNISPNYVKLPICSACVIIVTTGAGMFFFRRKNLK